MQMTLTKMYAFIEPEKRSAIDTGWTQMHSYNLQNLFQQYIIICVWLNIIFKCNRDVKLIPISSICSKCN